MDTKTCICEGCRAHFVIEAGDFAFYEKLSVASPSFCPKCRLQNRLAYRNERTLYKDVCAMCQKSIISMYAPDSGFTVYCPTCWWSDKWDAADYGRTYDFTRPFFSQFHELQKVVPRISLWQINSNTSPYANFIRDAKESYLSYSCVITDNVYYTKNVDRSSYVYDSLDVVDCNYCFQNIKSEKNYNSTYLDSCEGCLDSHFLYDCANCRNCFLSANLRNKEYYFLNQPYSKEEYRKKVQEFNVGSYTELQKVLGRFREVRARATHRYAQAVNCVGSTGNDIDNAKDARNCFSCYNLEHVHNATRSFNLEDSMDCTIIYKSELMYDSVSGGTQNSSLVRMSMHGFSSLHDVYYTDHCHTDSSLFGCIALCNKKFHILNQEYSEEEYLRLLPKIKEHMAAMPYRDNNGRTYIFGDFFPMDLSPFAYNETIAQEYFPLTHEKAAQRGIRMRSLEEKHYQPTVSADQLPDDIAQVTDDITKEVISCAHKGTCHEQCTTAYRIIPQELELYRKFKMPLPKLCPNCRHY